MNEVQKAIAQLNKDRFVVDFQHYRVAEYYDCVKRRIKREELRYSRKMGWLMGGEWIKLWHDPLPVGGSTQCMISGKDANGNDFWLKTSTECRSDEAFCYAQGRRVSLARALEGFGKREDVDGVVYKKLREGLLAAAHRYWKHR